MEFECGFGISIVIDIGIDIGIGIGIDISIGIGIDIGIGIGIGIGIDMWICFCIFGVCLFFFSFEIVALSTIWYQLALCFPVLYCSWQTLNAYRSRIVSLRGNVKLYYII